MIAALLHNAPGGCERALRAARTHCLRAADWSALRSEQVDWLVGPEADYARDPASGIAAVVYGWIDNAQEIAAATGTPQAGPAQAYAAAVARWGEEADRHLIGTYAAIAKPPGGGLQLARSPWSAPPLYFAQLSGGYAAATLLRIVFAAGAPRELDYARLADELAYDFREGDSESWWKGVGQVPLGATVALEPGGPRVTRWYDLDRVPEIRFADERDYVEGALALLDEAAGKALADTQNPILCLSGGLDSPLAADALVRNLPGDERLKAITFVPDREWDGYDPPGLMGSELKWVENFVRYNGRIDHYVADEAQGGFDYRSREMLKAMDTFVLGLANIGMYHGIWDQARALGCDRILTAGLGNISISASGRWTYVEYLRRGKWGQLARLLKDRPGDARPLWRRFAALSVMPQLPAGLRSAGRSLMHPDSTDMVAHLSPLTDDALAEHRRNAERRAGGSAWADLCFPRNRREAAQSDLLAEDRTGCNVTLASEQLYGIRERDVTAYRPLIEYCVGLPSEQFAHDGVERRLARRMGEGRMPEAQRLNTLHGQHNIDTFARLHRQREDWITYLDGARDHPIASRILDIDRLRHLMETLPERATYNLHEQGPHLMQLPRALLAAQFIGIVENSNQL